MDIIINLENCKTNLDLFKIFSDTLKINPPINKKWDAFCDTLFCIFNDSLLIKEESPTSVKYIFKNVNNYRYFDPEGYLNLKNILEEISKYKISSAENSLIFSFEIDGEKKEFPKLESLIINEGHPFLNLDKNLPCCGTIFKAEKIESNKRIFSKFIKGNDGSVYYTNNHFGDIENKEPAFLKLSN